ncbi:MAG: formylglycine-generating enzyme family protein [Magnetococcales bacterium]|nr:formylglycine-generating enzyme family protein [Magnetococcales bacterium]
MGRDRFGLWAEFVVGRVRQRMRWIPPGRFWMGSPEDEPGRDPDEGPRHEVTIEKGFWLFDTPCTQELWREVMGDNPSRFRDSLHQPVEKVSWEEVQKFIARINEGVSDLALCLPSEAQWEYACRAGTQIAPALDAVAWYFENSHDGKERKTHPVGRKAPNPWGLYDMLGNVWEWCTDHWHSNYKGAPDNGSAWVDEGKAGGSRVMRGGSWFAFARGVRAASRDRRLPGGRNESLGFRCARVPS